MESIPGDRIASLKSPKEGINLERLKHGEVKEGGRPSRDETSTRRVCGAWLPKRVRATVGFEVKVDMTVVETKWREL